MILSPESPDEEDMEDDKYTLFCLKFVKVFGNILRGY
jgi:hypothetical protein